MGKSYGQGDESNSAIRRRNCFRKGFEMVSCLALSYLQMGDKAGSLVASLAWDCSLAKREEKERETGGRH